LRSNSRSALTAKARSLPKASIFSGSPPISAIASRIAARSTTAGTPVKSCISTRAGW